MHRYKPRADRTSATTLKGAGGIGADEAEIPENCTISVKSSRLQI